MEPGPIPLSTLLYRYFFYGWLFRNVRRGTPWERAQAWRHNREQSRWLPTYICRWAVAGTLLLAMAALVDMGLECPTLAVFFYVFSALAVPINAVTAVCWGCLRHDRPLG
jgi:hypothetical protein